MMGYPVVGKGEERQRKGEKSLLSRKVSFHILLVGLISPVPQDQLRAPRYYSREQNVLEESSFISLMSFSARQSRKINDVRGRPTRPESCQPGHSLDASEEIAFRHQNQASGNSSPAKRVVPPERDARALNEEENNTADRKGMQEGRETVQQSQPGSARRAPPVRPTSEQRANAAPATEDHGITTNLRYWVSGDLEDDDDDDSNEEFCVESTPPLRRGLL